MFSWQVRCVRHSRSQWSLHTLVLLGGQKVILLRARSCYLRILYLFPSSFLGFFKGTTAAGEKKLIWLWLINPFFCILASQRLKQYNWIMNKRCIIQCGTTMGVQVISSFDHFAPPKNGMKPLLIVIHKMSAYCLFLFDTK